MEPSTSPAGVHLTDQASVAVRLARSLSQEGRANVAHLVAALAGEPEGLAGLVLRQRFGEVAPRITLHPAVQARALPTVSTAFVALPVTERPCWTLELLQAARRVGGEDLEYLLADCGAGLAGFADELEHWMPDPEQVAEGVEGAETFGRWSLLDRGFSRSADLAIARTRAQGGDSRDLLAWLRTDEATSNALSGAPGVPIEAVVGRAAGTDVSVDVSDLVTAITHLSLQASLGR